MADDNQDKKLQNEKEITSQKKQQTQQASEQSDFSRKESEAAASRAEFARSLTEELKDQMNIRRGMNETDKATLSLARQLQSSVAQNNVELGNSQAIGKQIEKDQKLLASITSEKALATRLLSKDQINLASEIAEAEQEKADILDEIYRKTQLAETLIGKAKDDLVEDILNQEIKLESLDAQLQTKVKDLTATGKITKAEIDRVAVLTLMEQNQEKNLKKKKEEVAIQKDINDKMGVTGALVEGVGGIMQRLGMRSGIFNDAMAEAKDTMFEMAEKSTRVVETLNEQNEVVKGTEENFGKVSIMLAGAGKLAKGFGKALFDPLTIILKIVDAFFKVDESSTKLQQLTGQNSTALAGFNSRLASSVDVLEVMADLTKQTGMNAQNIFSREVLAGAAELKNTLGLAGDEAGGLAMIAQTTSGNIDDVTASIVDTTSAFNSANRSAVSQGQILRDVAKASDGIKASLGGNPVAIAKAASAARRLGMELSQVDSIASSLMDFESSIEAELEAQLLTGKNINMSKARELALNNDLAGLGKELFKNSASLAEFGKMNRIQQEAQAKALGMTRDQLGKIAYQRALETNMTKEQAAAAAGVKLEDMERMAVQDKLAKAADKLAQAFAPMLDILVPIADVIGGILAPIAGVVGAVFKGIEYLQEMFKSWVGIKGEVFTITDETSAFGKILKGIGNSFASILGALPKLAAGIGLLAGSNAIKNLLTGKGLKFDLFDKIKEKALGAKDKIAEVGDSATEKLTKTTQNKVKQTDKPGAKSGGGLQGLAKGLKSMGAKGVLKGIGNLALSVIPLTLMVAAVPALMGLAAFGAAAGIGLTGLGKGLQAFGNAMKALGPQGLGYAALGLAALTVSLIGVGFALKLAAPAFEAIGLAIKSAFEGIGSIITAAAEGIASILREVSLEKAVALVAVGGAIAALGLGLASLGASLILGAAGIGVLAGIAAMADPLSIVGTSLTAIAAGLAAMQVALDKLDTEKLEEIKSLVSSTASSAPMAAATGAITSLVNGITGGGEDSSNASLEAKLDELISVVKQGGNINMDGNKVGQYIMLSANKSV